MHREMLVYKEGDPIYHSKMLTFYRREPFDLEAIYAPSKELPFPQTHIGIGIVYLREVIKKNLVQ